MLGGSDLVTARLDQIRDNTSQLLLFPPAMMGNAPLRYMLHGWLQVAKSCQRNRDQLATALCSRRCRTTVALNLAPRLVQLMQFGAAQCSHPSYIIGKPPSLYIIQTYYWYRQGLCAQGIAGQDTRHQTHQTHVKTEN